MLHTQLAALALAAAAVIASGCGSSKTESTTTAASTTTPTTTPSPATASTPTTSTAPVKIATGVALTHTQWIADGDAICVNTQAKLGTLGARTMAALVSELPQAATYEAVEAEELGKLVPPKSMAHDWETIVSGIHLYSEYTNQAAQYIKTTQKIGGTALAKADQLELQILETAKRDGFKRCSQRG
jgi:hypothetical protein